MSYRFSSDIGPASGAADRLEAAIAGLVRSTDKEQAAQAVAAVRAIDFEAFPDPIEIVVDGHVHAPDTVPSWIRVQVSCRDTPAAVATPAPVEASAGVEVKDAPAPTEVVAEVARPAPEAEAQPDVAAADAPAPDAGTGKKR